MMDTEQLPDDVLHLKEIDATKDIQRKNDQADELAKSAAESTDEPCLDQENWIAKFKLICIVEVALKTKYVSCLIAREFQVSCSPVKHLQSGHMKTFKYLFTGSEISFQEYNALPLDSEELLIEYFYNRGKDHNGQRQLDTEAEELNYSNCIYEG